MDRLKKIANQLIQFLIGPLIDWIRFYSSRRPFIKGDKRRVKLGDRVSLVNTLINVSSGNVEIGSDTIFGHNCLIVTGYHEFEGGMRKKFFTENILIRKSKRCHRMVTTSKLDQVVG